MRKIELMSKHYNAVRVLKGLCHAIFCYSSLYHFFTNSELTHVNEILSKGWNFTYIANVDDFVALFCYLPLVLDGTDSNLKNVGPRFFKLTFSQSVSILSNSAIHTSLQLPS